MKNKEKYALEIAEIAIRGWCFGVDRDTNKFYPCHKMECYKCIFLPKVGGCHQGREDWGNSDCEE